MIIIDVKSATTKELVATYNHLTGKSIKKFSSRVAGEKQVTAALAANPQRTAPLPGILPPKAVKVQGARRVRGAVASEGAGRPAIDYVVTLTPKEACSKPNSKSLRRQLIEWLEKRDPQSATITQIERHFGCRMRGQIGKLRDKNWLTTTEQK